MTSDRQPGPDPASNPDSADQNHACFAEMTFEVTSADTAHAVGSGRVDVLGTPRLLAWCEAATLAAVDAAPAEFPNAALTPGTEPTEVHLGTRVTLEHLRPSPIGSQVIVRAQLSNRDGKLLFFEVEAVNDEGVVLAHGTVRRVLVNRERWESRLA